MVPSRQRHFPRELKDMKTARRAATPHHIGPGMSHLRAQSDKFSRRVAPETSFPAKLSGFLSIKFWGWVWNYLKFRFGPRHAFQNYKQAGENGIYRLAGDSFFSLAPEPNEEVRVSLAGDWGTGTAEANSVVTNIKNSFRPHFTIHLGDVYFVGDQAEVNANCLGKPAPGSGVQGVTWPVGLNGGFAMNGNHEMYANGHAYFGSFFDAMGVRPAPGAGPGKQKASFFCLRNEFWDVIAVDTGYNSVGKPIIERLFKPSCKLENDLIDWLRQEVAPKNSGRGIVLLSHHQYFSSFEGSFDKPARQLAELIDRPVLWLWGHEHRFAVYGRSRIGSGIEAFGRCIGHGGMPVDIHKEVQVDRNFPLVLYDDREYQNLDGTAVGFNGFANLTFRGNTLTLDYRDLRNNQILTETWEVAGGRITGRQIEQVENDLTVLKDVNVAIGQAEA